MADLDRRGIPGVMVATEEFQDATQAQCRGLGFEPAVIWVPHPIQNRSVEELARIAADAIESIVAGLTTEAA
jgi:hypothetical protein|tara:strand:+ start:574 stop:789 length:216 start_codon:yes stop_codon:yes gene_type:complete